MPDMIYAIDYGTSNSLLAAADRTKIHDPIALDRAGRDPTVLKSILYAPNKHTWFFGAEAVDQYMEHGAEGRLLRSIKKFLPDPAFGGTSIHGRYYNLTEIIGTFLKEMRTRANAHFERDVTTVVLGRPATFAVETDNDDLAEKRLRAAAQLAGFKDVYFCPEPVAAAHEFRHQLSSMHTVLIADFGGGTSDFTVVRMGRERFTDKDILAVGGIPIAGDRFDGTIMKHMIAPHFGTGITYRMPTGSNDLKLPQHLINKLCSPADISFLSRKDIMQLLRDAQQWSLDPESSKRMERLFALVEEHLGYKLFKAIEQSKITLSEQSEATFVFEHPGIDLKEELFSADYRVFSVDLVERIVGALDETLKRAGVAASWIDIVCCTGGTARVPALAHELERRFGKDKLRQHRHFHSVIGGLADRAQALFSA
jgi:hypothetical chaperone protein